MTTPHVADQPIPSLIHSDVEDDLRATLRAVLGERSSWQKVLARLDTPEQPYDDDLWKTLAQDLGLAGLLIPERFGGAGATEREAALVLEELGRFLTPVPYLASAVLATTALLSCCPWAESDVAGDLAALADGSTTATLAVSAHRAPTAAFPDTVTGVRTRGAGTGGTAMLTGTVPHVLAADRAELLIVPALLDGAPHLLLVRSTDPGVSVTRETCLDATRPLGTVVLKDAEARPLTGQNVAVAVLRHAVDTGVALLASEQLGAAEAAFEAAVDYLRTRHQFGRPIGSFQALRHRAADLWSELAAARGTARYAAACAAEDSADFPLSAALAAAHVGDIAVRVAEESLHLHGGIGFTWEHPAHLYVKRAMSSALMFGSPDQHYAELARLADIPGA
ncbi:acyl-CoA dehydrogenase family protein [Yinghuangia soli]|uniref:Acyl-CoA/acyl-ACP dehydrogenase n=1 Tax=Yinghuangia soli TaxID=2908204 RepID=A0AA41Q3S6_9ACTN|nr:acyl-CoA dehydrogenase family protein [Yinghuangia soli]MCF2531004.1 acyl-CoA/acyl-ACP dehydrogenase [Yinghuangia soli]